MPVDHAIEIEILKGPDDGKRFAFQTPSIRIGRGSVCPLTLNDPKVGRVHLDVTRKRKGLFECTDLNSSNGTFLDGKRIKCEMVRAGTALRLGDTVLRIGRYQSEARGKDQQSGRWFAPKSVIWGILLACTAAVVVVVAAFLVSLAEPPPVPPADPESPEVAMQRLRQGDFAAAGAALWRMDSEGGDSRIWFRPGYMRMIEHAIERARRHERGGRRQFAHDEWLALVRRLETDPESPVNCPVFGTEWRAAVAWISAEKLDGIRPQPGQ
jgi:hypothetical protein